MTILDSTGYDLSYLILSQSAQYQLTSQLVLALLIAESNLTPNAEHFGVKTKLAQESLRQGNWELVSMIIDQTWPDVSFGLSQLTVQTAAGYGIGNGSKSLENVLYVREQLFDRRLSVELGCRHLQAPFAQSRQLFDSTESPLQSLIYYNSGSFQPRGNWYWREWPANISNYQSALIRAAALLSRV